MKDGWKILKSKGYKVVTTKRTWEEHQKHCETIGGRLASIPNQGRLYEKGLF